jgi:hypothetical protein
MEENFPCRNNCGKIFYNTNNRNRHENAYCKHKKEYIEQLINTNKLHEESIASMRLTIKNLENQLINTKAKFDKEVIEIRNGFDAELLEAKNKLNNVTEELNQMTNKYILSLEKTTTITTELAKASNETSQITANISGKSMSALNCLRPSKNDGFSNFSAFTMS